MRVFVSQRAERSKVVIDAMDLGPTKKRSKIGPMKKDLVEAIIVTGNRINKPTTNRKFHYELLNDPPVRNLVSGVRYQNDAASYKDLCDTLTRLRLEGALPWTWIEDETRPVTTWDVHADPQSFVAKHLEQFLNGYYRNLQQSQPNYIEVLAEKNTVANEIRDVCSQYCVPVTSGRGFCSARPRWDLLQRYRRSGKDKMILLIVSDLDPSGMYIAKTFAQSMRDDFGVAKVHAIKVAITGDQIKTYRIPHGEKIKAGDKTRGPAFRRLYGEYVYEVEALPDGELPKLLDDAIRSVIDPAAFNFEVDQEAQDALGIEAARTAAMRDLQMLELDDS